MEAWLFGLVILVGVAETLLSLVWNRLYFSIGIPIFRRKVDVSSPGPRVPATDRLEAALTKSAFPPLAFHSWAPDHYGFREKGWRGGLRLGYTPIMRGRLTFQPTAARVEVVGLLNWFTLFFVAFAFFAVPRDGSRFLWFLAGLLGLIYLMQSRRYGQVARTAAAEWSASGVV